MKDGKLLYVELPIRTTLLPHSELFIAEVRETLLRLVQIEYKQDTYWKEVKIWFDSVPAAIDCAIRGEEGGGSVEDY